MTTDIRSGCLVRPMQALDIEPVVDVHLDAFPGFFLTFLGPRFLGLLYGEAVALGEIAFVAEQDGAVVGFVMGSAIPGRFFKKLLKRKPLAFALAAAPAVLRQPRSALRIVRALAKPSEAAKPEGTSTLLSIGVSPKARGRGVGRSLALAFLREARARGARRVDLTTDKLDNEGANAFYRRLGFVVASELTTPEGRVMNEYELDLGDFDA